MTTLVVPRTFGGTLILNTAPPPVPVSTNSVLYVRDGRTSTLHTRDEQTTILKTRKS